MSVRLENVRKTYDGRENVVDGVSFSARKGRLLVLLGESGCGKTTTLKMINRLLEPSGGTIRIGGRDVTRVSAVEVRRSVGYVSQGIGLFPHMTVAENVSITPRLLGWDEARLEARVRELLSLVRLDPLEFQSRMPAELSGGQEQRVGFARALAAGPSVLLLDEPFAALDPITRDTLRADFRQLQRDLGLTTILVTHDMSEGLLLADWIVVMRRGRIVQQGTPVQLLNSPAEEYVSRLLETPRNQARHFEMLARSAGLNGDEA